MFLTPLRTLLAATRLVSLIALAWTLSAPTLVFAQGAASGSNAECRQNPHLARARELYDELQFDRSAETLQRAIEYANNCREDLAEIYRLKAFVDAVNGERERCHRDFEIFLALKPGFELPKDTPPKIATCFHDAESVAPSRRSLSIAHDAPTEAVPHSAPVSLKVEVNDPLRLVDQVRVFFRREGVKIYTEVSARADDTVSVVIPALSLPPSEDGYQIEYIVRAVDRWGGVLAENGSTDTPLTFGVEAGGAGSGPVGKWWFWTAVGVGVAAIATSVFFIARGSEDTIPVEIGASVASTGLER